MMDFVYRKCEAYHFEQMQWLVNCWGYHDGFCV